MADKKKTPSGANSSVEYDKKINQATNQIQQQGLENYAKDQAKTAAKQRQLDKAKADKKKTDQQKKTQTASAVTSANTQNGYVWVDGKRMQITGQAADGGYTVSYIDPTTGKVAGTANQAYPTVTAFGALDMQSIADAQDTQYVMSYGPGDIFSGKTDAVYGSRLGDHGSAANTVSGATNKMSVANGVQWLANLSTKDPEAYQAMVEKLHDSNYLTDSDYASAKGGFSTDLGNAFAKAAIDTAVINGTTGGEHTTLDEMLTQKAAGAQAAKAKAYVPVQRTYTDPTAIISTARDAAKSLLGRELTPDEDAQLTGKFHGLEAAKYDAIDAAGAAGKNATVTDPNATGQIDNYLHSGPLDQERANYSAAGYGGALRQLFGLGG